MHLAPGKIKIINKAQVEFVSASRVGKLRCAAFFEEGDLAVDTDGSKQRRYKSGNEVLRWAPVSVHASKRPGTCLPRKNQCWQEYAR